MTRVMEKLATKNILHMALYFFKCQVCILVVKDKLNADIKHNKCFM